MWQKSSRNLSRKTVTWQSCLNLLFNSITFNHRYRCKAWNAHSSHILWNVMPHQWEFPVNPQRKLVPLEQHTTNVWWTEWQAHFWWQPQSVPAHQIPKHTAPLRNAITFQEARCHPSPITSIYMFLDCIQLSPLHPAQSVTYGYLTDLIHIIKCGPALCRRIFGCNFFLSRVLRFKIFAILG